MFTWIRLAHACGYLSPIFGLSFAEGDGGDGGGKGNEKFYDGFPDDIKSNPTIQKYNSAEELAKAHIHLQSKISEKGVLLPKDDTPEERNRFFNAIGRPAKAEDYKFSQVEDVHPSIKTSPEAEKGFREFAHSIGLTQAQADSLNKWYIGNVSNMAKQDETAKTETFNKAQTTLRGEWGQKYEENVALAAKTVKAFGGDEALEALGDLGNNPVIVRMFHKIGSQISEDSINSIGVSRLTTDKNTALQKIKEMEADPKHPLNDPNHLKHAEAVKERTALYKIAYPE